MFLIGCSSGLAGKPVPEDPADTADTADTTDTADTADTAALGVTPSRGDLAATVVFDTTYDYPSIAAVADLDGDAHDELLLRWTWGEVAVLRLDVRTGAAALGWLSGEYRAVWALGNGQIAVKDDAGYAVLRLAAASDGWTLAERAEVDTIRCAIPTGDLDGDGVNDVLTQAESEVLRVVRGPVGADFDILVSLGGWSNRLALNCAAAAGDIDGDGVDDLAWLESDDSTLRIAFGPLRPGDFTVDSFPDLMLDVGQPLGDARAVVTEDLDGDGTNEVVVLAGNEALGFDAIDRSTNAITPEWTIDGAVRWGASGAPRVLAVATDREVGWWYGRPDPAATRPPATSPIPYYNAAVMGRFGGEAPVDLAWTSGGKVYGVPGTAAATGADADRDGASAPEDCNDADIRVRPFAPEELNGIDDDCDGAVDESTAAAPALLVEVAGERNDALTQVGLVAWSANGGAYALYSTAAAERLLVGTLVFGNSTEVPVDAAVAHLAVAGDLDADGHEDVAVLLTTGNSAFAVRGPAPGGELSAIDLPLDDAWGLDPVGDLDADGHADLLARGGHYDASLDWAFVQRMAWVAGDSLAAESIDGLGSPAPVGPVDLNRDGYDDLLVAEGAGDFWLGPLSDATAVTAAGASGQFTGLPEHVEAGDLDGDGASDLMGTGAAGLAVAFGPWTAANWDFVAEAEVNVGDRPAAALAWNADWLFMATSSDDWQPQVLGFRLPFAGEASTDDAELRVLGDQPRGYTGGALLVADLDGDGADELVVASSGEAAPADDEGVLRVYALP